MIWLLRGYLVKEEAFINLQNDTLIGLANSLMDPDEASRSLMDFQGDGIFKRVLDSGIDLTQEPFHRLQLLALYRFHVKEVNIFVVCTRRSLFGCAPCDHCSPGVHQVCTRCALGCAPGVHHVVSGTLPNCLLLKLLGIILERPRESNEMSCENHSLFYCLSF